MVSTNFSAFRRYQGSKVLQFFFRSKGQEASFYMTSPMSYPLMDLVTGHVIKPLIRTKADYWDLELTIVKSGQFRTLAIFVSRCLPLPPLVLHFCPEHLWTGKVRLRDPQVDTLQQIALGSSPRVYMIVRLSPENRNYLPWKGHFNSVHVYHPFLQFCLV